MARKKSIKLAATNFIAEVTNINTFLTTVSVGQTDEHVSWLHNYAIILLYREFESLMLNALVGAVNNDATTISATVGANFPKHLNNEVCEYLIKGGGYFDFKGRDGLIKTIGEFVPTTHYLLVTVKKPAYKTSLEQLSALRNFAAHQSEQSKRAALKAISSAKIKSAGSWLKKQNRFSIISATLTTLATDINAAAPY